MPNNMVMIHADILKVTKKNEHQSREGIVCKAGGFWA